MDLTNLNRDRKRGSKKSSPDVSTLIYGKVPPQAKDLEEAVLGAIMLEKGAFDTVAEILKSECFYVDAHQRIFNAMKSLSNKSQPIDMLTVVEELRFSEELDLVGGPYYVTKLTNAVTSSAHIEAHSRIILQKFIQRELIRISGEIISDAYEDSTDVFDLLDDAESKIYKVTSEHLRNSVETIDSVLVKTIQRIEDMRNRNEDITGVPSGFAALDRVTYGWQSTDLIILAARPSVGKCLGKGTRVLMYDGTTKPVEDVKIGDLLMGDDSTPRRVLSLARGQEMMYWVRQNRGMDYRVNESHILSLKRSRTEWCHQHGDVLNISVKEYLAKASKWKSNYKGYKVRVEFAYQDVPIEPYLLGLWLGDGKSDSARIFTQDEEVVEYLYDYAAITEQRVHVYHPEGKCPSYNITGGKTQAARNVSIQARLRELNVLNNKHIPQIYLSNTRNIRLQLLAGLIDSDGYVVPDSSKIEITTKYEDLAKQIKFLCDTLGFRTTLKTKRATISSIGYESTVWRIHIGGNIDEIPTMIKRKHGKSWTDRRDWTMTGIKVEQDKVDDYYGFVIDGNHLFLLEDCTVTHNTAFALNLARNAALHPTKPTPVAVFSLEMSAGQLVQRILAAESEIMLEKIARGKMEEYEMEQLYKRGIQKLADAKLFIDDTPALNIFELRAKCRRLKNAHNIGLIIIDYLQLMSGTGENRNGNREQEISNISRSLKALAKELQVPIIALSQLSREVEKRKDGNKIPQLSDLRESGAIEQDADMVCFIYRPEYHEINQNEMGESIKGETHLRIAKHRNGSLENLKFRARLEIQKFFEDNGDDFGGGYTMPPNWKPVTDSDGPKFFIQTSSKMNDLPEEDDPF